MTVIQCTNCKNPYPEETVPYKCLICGGMYDYSSPFELVPALIEPDLPGIWRYRHTFGLMKDSPVISLGEGNTPLVWSDKGSTPVAYKLEFINPTGSFKDRGSAVLVSFLVNRGVTSIVEDSSGNAGASLAAYTSRVGINARIFIPSSASGPKRTQIEMYGAGLVQIPGPRSKTAHAVCQMADDGHVYASHSYLPHGLAGFATIAYELFEQIKAVPGTVISPVGHGSLLLGIGRGFQALKKAGLLNKLPCLIGVQAKACAPIWSQFTYGATSREAIIEQETLAEGVRVSSPSRGKSLLNLIRETQGKMIAVDEVDIIKGREELARLGLYVEYTSAIVWFALQSILGKVSEPIVVILTGSGLKNV